MCYTKMMKWNTKHRKGTKQVCIMHTESGFTPSASFLDKYFKYREQCDLNGITPLECETYYNTPAIFKTKFAN